jgi:hypothetical protein
MSTTCQQCGAQWPDSTSCREHFEECLAYEYEHPATFGAVHHLMVACYMLQHNQYSRAGWIEARRLLERFLKHEVTPQEIRAENRARLDSGQRDWSITQGPRLAEFNSITWARTFAEVRLESPEIYCADVERWAAGVVADTRELIQHLE